MNKKYFLVITLLLISLGIYFSLNKQQTKDSINEKLVTSSKSQVINQTVASSVPTDDITIQEVEPEITVKVVKPVANINNSFIDVQGKVNSGKSLLITSMTDGRINKMFISVGDNVKKGQIIATISNVEAANDLDTYKNKLLIDKSSIDILVNKLRDYQEMLKAGIVARNDVIAIQNEINTKKIELEDIKLNINKLNQRKSNFSIHSPYSGYVSDVIAEGSFITYGQSVSTIIPIQEQYIEALVPSENIKDVKAGQEVTISGNEKGYISNISPIASFNMIKVIIKTNKQLSIGLDLPLKILTKTTTGLSIPKLSVVMQDGKPSIYLAKNKKAVLQNIEIDKDNNNQVIVSKGLTKTDLVITQNVENLSDGTKIIIQ